MKEGLIEYTERVNAALELLPSTKWIVQVWYDDADKILVEHHNKKAWKMFIPGTKKWEPLGEGEYLKIKNTMYHIEKRKQMGLYGL